MVSLKESESIFNAFRAGNCWTKFRNGYTYFRIEFIKIENSARQLLQLVQPHFLTISSTSAWPEMKIKFQQTLLKRIQFLIFVFISDGLLSYTFDYTNISNFLASTRVDKNHNFKNVKLYTMATIFINILELLKWDTYNEQKFFSNINY